MMGALHTFMSYLKCLCSHNHIDLSLSSSLFSYNLDQRTHSSPFDSDYFPIIIQSCFPGSNVINVYFLPRQNFKKANSPKYKVVSLPDNFKGPDEACCTIIKNASKAARASISLQVLLQKNTDAWWNQECANAFEKNKKLI